MINLGKQEVIQITLVMNGNPLSMPSTFSNGSVRASEKVVYEKNGKYYVNFMRSKREILKQRNCFIEHNWISKIDS